MIDVVIIGVYTIMEGVSGHLHVEQVLNRENQEEIKGVSVLRTVFKVGHVINVSLLCIVLPCKFIFHNNAFRTSVEV